MNAVPWLPLRKEAGLVLLLCGAVVAGCTPGVTAGLPETPTLSSSPRELAPVVTPDGTPSPDWTDPSQGSAPTPSPTTGPIKLSSKTSSPSHGMRYPVVESGPKKAEMNRVIQTWVDRVGGGEDPCPCDFFHSSYQVTRNDGTVLSVVMLYYLHNVHAASDYDARIPVSLDVTTGRQIKLTDYLAIDQKFMDAWITAMNVEMARQGSSFRVTDLYPRTELKSSAEHADVWTHDGGLPNVQSSLTSDGVTVSLLTPAGVDSHITVTLTNDQVNLRR